jgi:uncharacterized protein with HEPN domain
MKRLIRDYLEDIYKEMERAEKFVENLDFSDIMDDDKTLYACIRSLEIIGEAVKRIPDDFRKKYEEVPWKDMSGMRDVLIHDYLGANTDVIWKTIKEDIPKVKPIFKKMLEELEE